MQIILHIGQQKTGSTFIQSSLNANRERLSAQGMAFAGKAIELRNRRDASPHFDLGIISGRHDRAIISSENFYSKNFNRPGPLLNTVDDAELPRYLKRRLGRHATSWRVLCYVRRPDEHIVSHYQQIVKSRFAGTLNDFYEACLHNDYYHYASRMERWAEVFGEDAVEVRVFHRKTLQGNPFADFAQWLGLDPRSLSEVAGTRNESLDRVNVAILRFLSYCAIEKPELLRKHAPLQTSELISKLRAFDAGDRLQLDTVRANRLQEQFREDHERLAKRYLSPEHAAVLLAPVADAPPQPPLDRDALFARMMAVFNDPDLAGRGVEKAEHSTAGLWKPEDPASWPHAWPGAARRRWWRRVVEGVRHSGRRARRHAASA